MANPITIICPRHYESFKEGYTSGGGKQTRGMLEEVGIEVFLGDMVPKQSQRLLARPKGRRLNILGKKESMSSGLQA